MQYITVLAGASFRPGEAREALRLHGAKGTPCRLEAEPSNPYDVNAIRIYASLEGEEHFIGYVARTDNAELSIILSAIDSGDVSFAAEAGLTAPGFMPVIDRCEIFDFTSGPLKPTIIIEVSTGWEVGTQVRGPDTDGENGPDYLP